MNKDSIPVDNIDSNKLMKEFKNIRSKREFTVQCISQTGYLYHIDKQTILKLITH